MRVSRHHPAALVRGLYVVTSERRGRGRTHLDVTRAAIEAGATVVQFRDKLRTGAEFAQAALPVRNLCREHAVAFVVNDDVECAMLLQADGVHLGQDDLEGLVAWNPGWDAFLGISVRTPAEAVKAVRLGADYVGAGPVFATSTKLNTGAAIGLQGLRKIRAAVPVPIAAIGGIDQSRIGEVLSAGADAVCVISAIVSAPEMSVAASALAAEVRRWA